MILKDVIETKVINNLNWEENLFPTILSWHCKYEMPGPSLFKVIEGKDKTYKREDRITESGWLFFFFHSNGIWRNITALTLNFYVSFVCFNFVCYKFITREAGSHFGNQFHRRWFRYDRLDSTDK